MGNASVQRGLFLTFRGFPSSVTPYGVPPSPWGKATSRRGSVHRGLALTFRGPLHTRPGFAGPPSPSRRGQDPSSVRAFGPATFPVGEGCLRRGSVHRGLALTFWGPLHTRPGLRPVHPLQAGEGRNPSSVTPYGVPPSPWGKATSRRGLHTRGPFLVCRGPLRT